MSWTYRDVAKTIDHALLQPTLTDAALDSGCELARQYGVASVCIVPHGLRRAAELLAGSGVQPSTTIGFPHGSNVTATKVFEAERALSDGATELDLLINVGKALGGEYTYVEREIREVLDVTHGAGAKLKIIFENCYLAREQKLALCRICSELGVDWVKTSTGFGTSGASADDVRLMREHSAAHVQVKASGGIRTLEQVLELRALGASRVGTSSTRAILDEARAREGLAASSQK